MYYKAVLVALLALKANPSAAAKPHPAKVPERTQCKFPDGTDVTVEYGGMKKNGRKIFGGLVPYGRLWKTGPGRSPSFVTSANLVLGGKEVSSGRYRLLTIPDPDRWEMVLEKEKNGDSPSKSEESSRVERIDLAVRRLPSQQDNFSISFDQVRGGCLLNLRWEETEASGLLAEKGETPPPK